MNQEVPRTHRLPVRVYYEDTDAGGVVYHTRYLAFAERARTELLRAQGIEHAMLLDQLGVLLVVRRLEADYRRPARLDDALVVESSVREMGAASCWMRQSISRQGEELVVVDVQIACVGRDGRVARMPEIVVQRLT